MIIVITRPDFFEGEAAQIVQLLDSGQADLIHIRKPGIVSLADSAKGLDIADLGRQEKLECLIQMLPARLYGRLVLHDCHQLAVKYGLRGVHLNRRNPQPPTGWGGSVSISCHSLQELASCRHQPFDYMSLSPIFDSISKPGYHSVFSKEQIAAARKLGLIDQRVMALGGVTFDKVEEVEQMGFGGAMILGDAWKLY